MHLQGTDEFISYLVKKMESELVSSWYNTESTALNFGIFNNLKDYCSTVELNTY